MDRIATNTMKCSLILFLSQYINFSSMKLAFHVYQLHKEGPVQEEIEEEGDVPAATHWLLPNSNNT